VEAVAGDRMLVFGAFVIPGLSYPVWSTLAPGPHDPFAAWLAIGATFLLAAGVALWRRPSRSALLITVSGLAALVTLHFFLLAFANDMAPFYAVGSSMAVLATVLFIRSLAVMAAYGVFVLALAASLFAADPDGRKLAYWAGTFPVFVLAYQRLTTQLAGERRLETMVAERTRQLSDANQRLRDEMAARARLEEKLRVQHKMEAVGRLAGGVAHDFNNLLTTIGVYADLLLSDLPDDSPLRDEVSQIRHAHRQAAALTQQLLTLGRRHYVELDVLDLNEVLSDMASLLRHVMSPGQRLEIDLADADQPIRGNLDQLQQIVLNLAINARDAMEESGRLRLSTRSCTRGELERRDLAPGPGHADYVCLAVEDTGCGMSAEARDRAFDPFYTTKAPEGGSGLGLSIVHGIVSQAGGHVRLGSEPGQGTRVELFWPRETGPRDDRTAPSPGAGVAGHERILLVEDEEGLRGALHRVLATGGYAVTEAESGEQAAEILARPDEAFDLVVTDVVMPRMSGFELAERLRALQPRARVLLISGHLNDRSLGHRDPSLPFLAKPFPPKELMAKVREVLDVDEAAATV